MISSFFRFLLLSLSVFKIRKYCLCYKMAKLNSKKRKKSSFYDEKSLVGLTPGISFNFFYKLFCLTTFDQIELKVVNQPKSKKVFNKMKLWSNFYEIDEDYLLKKCRQYTWIPSSEKHSLNYCRCCQLWNSFINKILSKHKEKEKHLVESPNLNMKMVDLIMTLAVYYNYYLYEILTLA